MHKYITAVSTLLLASGIAIAQPAGENSVEGKETSTHKIRTIETALNPWLLTNNAAGLSIAPLQNNGKVQFLGEHHSGDYRRAQEGDKVNRFLFDADMYTNLGKKLYMYGRIGIDINREFNKAWYDAIDPYNGNPYGYGGSRPGNYDTEAYELEAKIASREIHGFRFGLGLDYATTDFSRVIDPRPRNLIADYALHPSVTYSINNNHTIGISGRYHFRRQKLQGISTWEEDKYNYYEYFGLEKYEATVTGNFEREFEEKTFGGEINYSFRCGNLSGLIGGGYEEATEKVMHDKEQPGRYHWRQYNALLSLTLSTGKFLHSGNLKFSYRDSWADYYIQEQIVINDGIGNTTKIWVNKYEALAYKYFRTNLSGQYRMYSTSDFGYDWYVGLSGSLYGFDSEYFVPHSEMKASVLNGSIDFGADLFRGRKGNTLFLEGSLKGRLPGKNNIEVADKNILYTNVLRPDMSYYKCKAIGGDISLRYDFNLRVKTNNFLPYIKIYGSTMYSGMKSTKGGGKANWSGFGGAIGLNLN